MWKMMSEASTSLILVLVALTALSAGLIQVQGEPLLLLLRNIALAGLGENSPGLVIEGDNRAPDVDCDRDTGRCKVED